MELASIEDVELSDEDIQWLVSHSLETGERGLHGGYFFNIRTDSESVFCACSDAATWPTQEGQYKWLSDVFVVEVYDDNGELVTQEYVHLP